MSDVSHRRTWAGLALAILAVSWSAILVRWAEAAPALVIAFYRMFWSSLLFAGTGLLKGGGLRLRSPLTTRQKWIVAGAGILLALHFATWIGSLKFTTVAHSLTLYATQPIFALLFGPFLLDERGDLRAMLAAGMAMVGVAVIAGLDVDVASPDQLFGDLLALSSAVFMTLYLFAARAMRAAIDLHRYLVRVYGGAAALLLLMVLLAGEPLVDYPPDTHLMMLLLALVPTGIGHSLLNWAARRLEAYKVNMTNLGEPVVASALAALFFAEFPGVWFYPGAALILAGIAITLRR